MTLAARMIFCWAKFLLLLLFVWCAYFILWPEINNQSQVIYIKISRQDMLEISKKRRLEDMPNFIVAVQTQMSFLNSDRADSTQSEEQFKASPLRKAIKTSHTIGGVLTLHCCKSYSKAWSASSLSQKRSNPYGGCSIDQCSRMSAQRLCRWFNAEPKSPHVELHYSLLGAVFPLGWCSWHWNLPGRIEKNAAFCQFFYVALQRLAKKIICIRRERRI